MNRAELERYIANTYSVQPDYPWSDTPDAAVFRHFDNKKWFAIIMKVQKCKLGLEGSEKIDIVNFKCEPVLIDSLLNESGFFPAYHMNKVKWITAALDGTAQNDKIKMVLDMSFDLTSLKIKNRRKIED